MPSINLEELPIGSLGGPVFIPGSGNIGSIIGSLSSGAVGTPNSLKIESTSVYEGGPEEHYDGLFGIAIGKKAKARVAVKVAARKAKRQEKAAIKTDRKKARIENIRSKSSSRMTLAEQGIAQKSGFGEAIGGVASLAQSFLGGGGGGGSFEAPQMQQMPDYSGVPPVLQNPTGSFGSAQAQMQERAKAGEYVPQYNSMENEVDTVDKDKKKKQTTYIIVGVVAVVAVLVAIFLIKKK